jgi:hypothetical protein
MKPASRSTSKRLERAVVAASAWFFAAAAPAVTNGDGVTQIKISSQQVEQAFTPRRLVLLVGVRSFADQRFRSLQFPGKDVADFRTFLRQNNTAPTDEEIVLLDENATAAHMLAALDELERTNTSADDIVLVYLSTHGTLAYEDARRLKRYAVMRDTSFDKVAETGVSLEYLQSRIARLKSDRKALVLALCHSGTGKSELPDSMKRELETMKAEFFPQPLHEVSSAMMVLSASAFGQPAREDAGLANDIYTHFLLQGLQTNDVNGDGAVSLFEAHEYARSRTYDFTRGQQTPTALINLEGTDPIILKGRVTQKSQPMIFADSERFRDVQVIVNGERKGTLWQPQRVPPGRIRLTLVDPQNPDTPLMDHSVYVNRSAAYGVSSLFARQPTWSAELRAYDLPLPDGLDGLGASDYWAPGAALRAGDVLGTPLNAAVGYYHRGLEGRTTIEGQDASSSLTVTAMQASLGLGYFPARTVALSLGLGVERMVVERVLTEEAIDRTLQHAAVTYPVVTGEVRALQLVDQVYAGAGVSVVPAASAGLEIDGAKRRLRPLSTTGFLGYSF